MLTLCMVVVCFVIGALVISAVAGIIAMSPVILAIGLLILVDVLVVKLLFGRKKKKDKE